ncbi:MAG TPA: aminotransferase class I/II-fold pyridoxal phosphate-dependent enzyme [Gemmatimonadaceae bacterium]|nr:aminotransferase class I/II-fold pyridoxal phosphate-dependent enzyme [Gemmatimonadaceae bacterium]
MAATPHAAPPDRSLEPTGAEMRDRIERALSRVIAHIESLPDQPAAYAGGAVALARSLAEGMPEDGQSYDELLAILFDRAAPTSFNTAGPGYLAYIPGGGLFDSAVADLIGDTLNRYVGVWVAAPGLAQIEANVVHWLAEIVGYPAGAGGFLTSGGSLANFSAVVTARAARLPENFLAGTIYTSGQAHHSVQKAAMLAGFPTRSVRSVPTDAHFRVRVDAMERAIASDRKAGLAPFMIVGNAGTTNTGAVDDLGALADLAEREGLWLHVDAAYGGFFMLTERGRTVMRGIDRSHSVTLDPHKGMFLPYGTGSLLVRDTAALERAHALDADYLPSAPDAPEAMDFSLLSPELTRPFRGLRVWLPVKLHGIGAFRRNLDEKLDLARWATDRLREIPGIEIVADPQLSVVAFRLARPGMGREQLNQLNRRLIDLINARQRVHLSGTLLDGRFVLRICVLSFRTHLDRVRDGIEDIRGAVDQA